LHLKLTSYYDLIRTYKRHCEYVRDDRLLKIVRSVWHV
jgi:hypothetical protein